MHLCTETGASTVWAAIMGPMVDPHGQSLRTTNSWHPMLALRESSRITKPVVTCWHRRVRDGGGREGRGTGRPRFAFSARRGCRGACAHRGGVALVVVGLDDRALVEERAVVRLVLGRVVGVHGVRHVSRDDKRAAQRELVRLRVRADAEARVHALHHLRHDRAARAVRAVRTDLRGMACGLVGLACEMHRMELAHEMPL
jgi:hypothetical protein